MVNKKLIALFLLTLTIFLIVGCGSKSTPTTDSIPRKATEAATKTSGSSEIDRYIKLEAEFACKLLGIEDGNEIMAAMQDFVALADKHGFTEERIQELKLEYEDSAEFQQKAMDEMKAQCPDKMALLDTS